VRVSAQLEIPEVCMMRAVAKADSRRCSKCFKLVFGGSRSDSVASRDSTG